MQHNYNNIANKEFYWGVGTSAFQIEGSPLADGACESDWYRLTHMAGKIVSGDTADIACDHYNRWQEDIALMKAIGVNSYRFSIAWSRIIPSPGKVNPEGLEFYSRLIDGLLKAGIEPFVTIFHWDLPAWLDDMGGWLNPDSVKYFTEYSKVLFDNFGDRVKYWLTLNEPYVYYHSYVTGWHWPFRINQHGELLVCLDNMLAGHQNAVNECPCKIGMVLSYHLLRPASDSPEDIRAASIADGVRNRWFLERTLNGKYPKDIIELYGDCVPEACHLELASSGFRKPDFIGLNYYAPGVICHDPSEPVYKFNSPIDDFELQPVICDKPEGLFDMVKRVHDDYGPIDLFITENGYLENISDSETYNPLHDDERVDYLRTHLKQVLRCVEAGLPLKGYIHWSLLDNFEWRWGLDRLFGLVYVDRKTQNRRLKKSAYWYRDFINSQKNPGGYISDAAAKIEV